MERGRFTLPSRAAHLIVPLLLAVAALWVRFAPPPRPAGPPGLRPVLPAVLGPYEGQLILHCQNDQCRAAFPANREEDYAACPRCGSPLSPLSAGEKASLPPDTVITRRLYRSAGSAVYTVSLVLAGSDARSIHRPQQCLPGQGYSIDGQRRQRLALAGGRTLEVVRIDARHGPSARHRFGFVYWFVGPDRTTASTLARHYWTMHEQLIRNRPARWAYVAVTVGEPLDTPESEARLASFLSLLLPQIESL